MAKVNLEVISIKDRQIELQQVNHGTIRLNASARTPALEPLKLKVGDIVEVAFKKLKSAKSTVAKKA